MHCKVCVTSDWPTSVGELKENHTYAIPQEIYKNEVYGKVGHVNYGICSITDAEIPNKPALPAILYQDAPPKRSHHKKEE